MHDIRLNIGHEIGKVERLGWLDRVFGWIGQSLERRVIKSLSFLLDKLLVHLTGYHEVSLQFSASHAEKEIPRIRKYYKKLKYGAERLKEVESEIKDVEDPLLRSVAEKYIEIDNLIDDIEKRLSLIVALEKGPRAIEELPENLRRDALELSIMRFKAEVKEDPEGLAEIKIEMDDWLEADLGPVIEENG